MAGTVWAGISGTGWTGIFSNIGTLREFAVGKRAFSYDRGKIQYVFSYEVLSLPQDLKPIVKVVYPPWLLG